MRVLHVVKTSEGAVWAARQAGELVKRGVEVHAAIPSFRGAAVAEWRRSGARLHVCDLDFPARAPWRLPEVSRTARRLVDAAEPDLVHSHFVGTTLTLRHALGGQYEIPRVFQAAGPLHLEHRAFRALDLATAGPHDYWIGSSKYVTRLYLQAGAPAERVFLSYHGGSASNPDSTRRGLLRLSLGISSREYVVGNANYMYPPRTYLGQRTGIKSHEQVIDALAMVVHRRQDVVGVLIGGEFGGGCRYERMLRDRARSAAGNRIRMPGALTGRQIATFWPDFDCAVHVPRSENCGGVLEPLLAGVPVIAARVGGLPELVQEGVTGKTVSGSDPAELAEAILEVLGRLDRYRAMAARGRSLARAMFDVRRTAGEVAAIYRHILNPARPRPAEADAATVLEDNTAPLAIAG